jgi:predicted esterase
MVLTNGAPLDKARNTIIMLHGRGASAYDILSLSTYLDQEHTAFLAPQAALGATVTQRIYPNMGHSVNEDEIEFVREALKA